MKTKYLSLFFTIVVSATSFAQLKTVEYGDKSQKLSGLAGIPNIPNKNKPGILILPAWKGIDKHSEEVATELMKLGYFSFVADIYGVDERPKDTKEAGKLSSYYKTNYKQYQNRIAQALAELVKQGANLEEIVVIGYCFGGTGALEAARANMDVKGVVSFHGGLGRDHTREISSIKAKVLVLHGADDTYVSEVEIKEFQDEMRTSHADWQMNYYANAVHAFTEKQAGNDNSKGAAYNALADKRSWAALRIFLRELFD